MTHERNIAKDNPSTDDSDMLDNIGRLIYCDKIAGIAVGPSVTRMSLSLDSGEKGKPVNNITDTVVIPTAAFLQFIAHTVKLMGNQEVLDQLQDSLANAIANIKSTASKSDR